MQPSEDKITKYVDKDVEDELSPMNPPDAFEPPGLIDVSREEMSPFLQSLMDDHDAFATGLDAFEGILNAIPENGITEETNAGLSKFFEYFDTEFIAHHKNEERELFPALKKKLVEEGEHSQGAVAVTGVDVMIDEHLRAIQLAAIVFNFFGLSARLPDPASRLVALDAAIEQGRALVEVLRLHMFREDKIIFPLAHTHLSRDTMDGMTRTG